MKYVAIMLGLLMLAAQQPQEPAPGAGAGPGEENANPLETRIPPGHYCKRPDVTISPRETKAHHCSCKHVCKVDEEGNLIDADDNSDGCLAFCHLNNRRCTCHIEEPCDPQGNALADMDGHVVAVLSRPR